MKKEYCAKFERVEQAINECIPRHNWIFNDNGKTLDDKIIRFATASEIWQELREIAKTDANTFRTVNMSEWYVIEACHRIAIRKGLMRGA